MQTGLINESHTVTLSLRTSKCSVECNEEQLVTEAKGGSVTAFEQLVQCYETRVFRLAQTIAHTREDAEEIVQTAFVKAFKNLPHFRGDSRFYTWLVRITINEALMKVRRRHLNEMPIDDAVETEEGILARELEDWGPNPEERYSQQELQDILATTIGELSPGHRTVFQLRYVEGFSTGETAEALTLSTSAVKTRLRRARFQLRQSLNNYFKPVNGDKRLHRGSARLAQLEFGRRTCQMTVVPQH
jgi:RNA polymerase sigma-70 factor, ECF subfamily